MAQMVCVEAVLSVTRIIVEFGDARSADCRYLSKSSGLAAFDPDTDGGEYAVVIIAGRHALVEKRNSGSENTSIMYHETLKKSRRTTTNTRDAC